VKADLSAGLYHGAVIKVARAGKVFFEKAIGAHDGAQARPLALDSVFSIFSVTKAFTNLLTLRAIEEGRYALTTRVCEVIPEFKGKGREAVTFFHLLSHQSGFPIIFEVKPNWYIDRFDDVVRDTLEVVYPATPPGERLAYAPLANHVLMGEALRRTDPNKRSYRDIVTQDLPQPAEDERHGGGSARGSEASQGGARLPRQLPDRPPRPQQPRPPTAPSKKSMPRCLGWASCRASPTCSASPNACA